MTTNEENNFVFKSLRSKEEEKKRRKRRKGKKKKQKRVEITSHLTLFPAPSKKNKKRRKTKPHQPPNPGISRNGRPHGKEAKA